MTTVKLSSEHGIKDFPVPVAERLLKYEKKHGLKNWELADSNFELKEDGIIGRIHKGEDKKSKGKGATPEGDISSE